MADQGARAGDRGPSAWALGFTDTTRTGPERVPRVLAVVATPVGMRVLVAKFKNDMISENVQVFWAALQRG